MRAMHSLPPRASLPTEFEEAKGYQITMKVNRCFFHSFFTKHDTPFLTRIFCDWDGKWNRVINPQEHGIAFHRPEVLSAGDPSCRFEFARVEKIKMKVPSRVSSVLSV